MTVRSKAVRSGLQTTITVLSAALTAIMVVLVALSVTLPSELPYAH